MTLILTKHDPDGTSRTTDALETLVNSFEDHGATFTIRRDGTLHIDLDGLGPPPPYADGLAAALNILMPAIRMFIHLRTLEGQRN